MQLKGFYARPCIELDATACRCFALCDLTLIDGPNRVPIQLLHQTNTFIALDLTSAARKFKIKLTEFRLPVYFVGQPYPFYRFFPIFALNMGSCRGSILRQEGLSGPNDQSRLS